MHAFTRTRQRTGMSLAAMSWAFTLDIRGDLKLTLLALADYADGNGVCFPGQKNLARKASTTERTLRRRLQELEEIGIIQRRRRHLENGNRTSDEYQLVMGLPANLAAGLPAKSEGDYRPTVSGTGEPSVEPSVTTTARARQMPADMTWTNAHSLKATGKGLDIVEEFAKFQDHHLAKGSKFVDWDRALHTWLNNARPAPRQHTGTPARKTPTDRMNDVLAIQDPREQGQLHG